MRQQTHTVSIDLVVHSLILAKHCSRFYVYASLDLYNRGRARTAPIILEKAVAQWLLSHE